MAACTLLIAALSWAVAAVTAASDGSCSADGKIGLRATESTPEWPAPEAPPAGAPNVLLILLDDVGFGAASTFGGPIPTPNFDKVADRGLKYTRFHTTALCSPTRAALLTGRNHHTAHNGAITEIATGFPGYDSLIGKDTTSFVEVLRQKGYRTAWYGKNHNVPVWHASSEGPFDLWYSGFGFQDFYGFIGGETNQWRPDLFDGTKPVEPYLNKSDYILNTDLADQAIKLLDQHSAISPDKPFLVYFAPGATHAPHHAPKDWIAKFKGEFDHGWDRQREITFDKMKSMGVLPKDARLTPRPSTIPAWEAASADEKRLYARMMEVYAAFLAHTDYEIGRVLDRVRELGQEDNTLVMIVIGDNGASAEGTMTGLGNEMTYFNMMRENTSYLLEHIDDLGSDWGHNHYPVGWAWAMNAPFQWCKQVASHFGGTRNPLVVSWPKAIPKQHWGQVREQFHHVIDVAPTILEAAGLQEPKVINGVEQKPIEGASMVYSFLSRGAKDARTRQYFEILGNMGMYSDGWMASATPLSMPWDPNTGAGDVINDTKWELYNLAEDFSQANDLASEHPEKVKALRDIFFEDAAKYQVLPIDKSKAQRLLAPRPTILGNRTKVTYRRGMGHVHQNAVPRTINADFKVTARFSVPSPTASGVLATIGGRFGGWVLYLREGALVFHYNVAGMQHYEVATKPKAIRPGAHEAAVHFKYNGGGIGKGGVVTLFLGGKEVAKGDFPTSTPTMYGGETFDVGRDAYTAAALDYDVPNELQGEIQDVTVESTPWRP